MNITIRQETISDYEHVYDLVKAAFTADDCPAPDEQELVLRLRKSRAFVPQLSLVAVQDGGKLIGHILFTEVKVSGQTLLALAPLSVLPDAQNQGVGGKLIREGHGIAAALGYKGAIVLGHAGYYPKFGYVPANRFHISAPFEVPDDSFLAIQLQENGLQGIRGVVEYPKEFFE